MKKALILCVVVIWGFSSIVVQAAGHTHGENCYTTTEGHKHTGSAEAGGGCYSTPVYHTHSGSSSAGGGCYTTPIYHTHSGSFSTGGGCYTTPVTCGGSIIASTTTNGTYSVGPGAKEYAVGYCPFCQQTHSYCTQCGIGFSCGGFRCGGHPVTVTTYKCDKCGTSYSAGSGTCEKIVSYTTACGHNETTPIGYELSCGKTEQTVERYELSCSKAECEATRTLTCTIPEETGELPKPSESPKPSEPQKPSEKPKPSESPKPSEPQKPSEKPKPSEEPKPSEPPKVSEAPKSSEVPKLSQESEKREKEIIEIKDEEVPKSAYIAAGTATATGTGGIAFFAVFWIFKKCSIFSYGELIGKVRIRKKKGQYFIKIPFSITQKSEGDLSVVFRKNFVNQNEGEIIEIMVNDHVYQENIQEEISINEDWMVNEDDENGE